MNHVSDQLLEEWRVNRPDIVIADFITLSAGFVAEELEIPWITTMATPICNRNSLWSPLLLRRDGSRAHEEGKRRYKHHAVNSLALENTVGLSSYANA